MTTPSLRAASRNTIVRTWQVESCSACSTRVGWADLGRLPELFCGLDRRRGEGPTLYPVACSPQAWAAGAVFLLVQACLGVSIQGASSRILFDRPYLPEGIPQLWIKGLRTSTGSADVFFER
jgi:glycogen debranching enzyme